MRTPKQLALSIAQAANSTTEKDTPEMLQSRRLWLKNMALFSASGALLMACGKDEKKVYVTASYSADDAINDAGILNTALALEHEAISIYTQAAGLSVWTAGGADNGGNLGSTLKQIAVGFAGHHTEHKNALILAIESLNATYSTGIAAVTAKTDSEYLPPDTAATLTSVKAVLRVAADKELGAAKAYMGAIKSFKNPEIGQTSGFLGGDEAAHYGAIRAALLGVIGDTDVTAATVIAKAFVTKA